MDKTTRIIAALIVIGTLLCTAYIVLETSKKSQLNAPFSDGSTSANDDGTVYFFYGEECPHCHVLMPFITNLSRKYPDANIRILEVWHNQTNQEIYQAVNKRIGTPPPGVPEVVIGSTVLVGDRDIPLELEQLIQEMLKKR